MNVPISEPLQQHIERRLAFAFRRHAARVDHVVVRLVDLNGPKGGPDKRCMMVAQLSSAEVVIAEATDADAYAAVSLAAARLDSRATRILRRAQPGLPSSRGATRIGTYSAR